MKNDCNYESLPGKEFVFREQSESLQKYGYLLWKKAPDMRSESLSYKDYVGKKGKILEQQVEDRITLWHVAVLDTCEKVYTSAGLKSRPKSIEDIEKFTSVCFLSTIKLGELMKGKSIWVNNNGMINDQSLFTDDPSESYQLSHLESLEVEGVSTRSLGRAKGAGPLYLKVKKQTGEKGYMVFNDQYYFRDNPIVPSWDNITVDSIKNRKLMIGMNDQQVVLAWGKPKQVNKTIDANGVREQWVYGQGQYVYLENGVLKSIQVSQ